MKRRNFLKYLPFLGIFGLKMKANEKIPTKILAGRFYIETEEVTIDNALDIWKHMKQICNSKNSIIALCDKEVGEIGIRIIEGDDSIGYDGFRIPKDNELLIAEHKNGQKIKVSYINKNKILGSN